MCFTEVPGRKENALILAREGNKKKESENTGKKLVLNCSLD